MRKQLDVQTGYPVYQNSITPLGFYNHSNRKAESTFVIGAGAAGEIGYSRVDFWAADDCFTFERNESVLERFLYHCLCNRKNEIRGKVRTSSIPRLSSKALGNIRIPLPPLPVQARIVETLDRFDALTNSITEGLPAEIAARQKQYEYYRDKLLAFPEKGKALEKGKAKQEAV